MEIFFVGVFFVVKWSIFCIWTGMFFKFGIATANYFMNWRNKL